MSRILVVDDDTDILSVMEILLTMKGFEVEVTAKGENTIPKINSFKPDLILLHVLISGHDGRTICKQLKSDKATQHIPVIMFSADPNVQAGIKSCKADDFLAKPFDIDDLLNKITHHIN